MQRTDAGALAQPVLAPSATTMHEGPSVTYHLRSRLTVPSRNDQQLIEVARIETKPEYYYKAVPILTSHVYRLADLSNKSEYVLLAGRGDDVRRLGLRGQDEPAAGRHRRALHGRLWR